MKVGIVDTEDISVVVQGPVVTNTDYYPNGWTNEALKRIRRFFPGAEVIFSTWKGTNAEGLDADLFVFNDDPGFTVPRGKIKRPFNVNRQILSSISGLKRASRKYAMKMRSDTLFKDNVILEFFGKYKERIEEWKVFRERIVTFVARNPRRYFEPKPFLIADWLHFGLREDVVSLWDIPLAPEPETSDWFATRSKPSKLKRLNEADTSLRYGPEQYIWITFLKKFGNVPCEHLVDQNTESVKLTELVIANNLVLLDFKMMGIEHLKFIGNKETGALNLKKLKEPKFKRFLEDLVQETLSYNHYQWQSLYEKYCLNKHFRLPHLAFDIINPAVCNSYLLSKKIYKSVFKKDDFA